MDIIIATFFHDSGLGNYYSVYLLCYVKAPGSKPVVKCLLPEGETWKIVENHFSLPVSGDCTIFVVAYEPIISLSPSFM